MLIENKYFIDLRSILLGSLHLEETLSVIISLCHKKHYSR
jgi:hypothetical protein